MKDVLRNDFIRVKDYINEYMNSDKIIESDILTNDGIVYKFRHCKVYSVECCVRMYCTYCEYKQKEWDDYSGDNLLVLWKKQHRLSNIKAFVKEDGKVYHVDLIIIYDEHDNEKYTLMYDENTKEFTSLYDTNLTFKGSSKMVYVLDNDNIIEAYYQSFNCNYNKASEEHLLDIRKRWYGNQKTLLTYFYNLSDDEVIAITLERDLKSCYDTITGSVVSVQVFPKRVCNTLYPNMDQYMLSITDTYKVICDYNIRFRGKLKRTDLISSQIELTTAISKKLAKMLPRKPVQKKTVIRDNGISETSMDSITESYREYEDTIRYTENE